ncbi:helix-turn-helix domain-containing protein [Ferrimonas balearica]|uniref:helix-turn-helix domain-containing protein n=1 Tax=Ferrimonas balearica TaxID=44012 RepID=UPI001C98FBCF|nr:helix-turn-helix domain-containing protein [Ferrimonas balearica]MBY5992971.1 winged helix-turn-helix domain-containing protein [Ferrimonas balearica]
MLNPTFCRRVMLLLAIEELDRPSVPALMSHLGWPRRTIQDIIKALPGLGVAVHFVEDGVRHNDGYYQVDQWGGLDAQWARANRAAIVSAIEQA